MPDSPDRPTEPPYEPPTDLSTELPTPPPLLHSGLYDRFRRRVTRWAAHKGNLAAHTVDAVLTLPDVLCLLTGLAADPDVPAKQKAKVVLAIVYLVSPIDLLPASWFGSLGFLDDLAVAVIVLDSLLNHVELEVVERHWRGERDLVVVIRQGLAVADELVGKGLLRRITRFLES